ncbi:dethiobiotin synthase [Sandaracinus amylolyticus]|uniref:dethiobiotin synthase n=1 Tax=Sandaracinus amylolyticus TaxID=927083 RepID=UPI001F3985EE|nr:dethiobiotin synthase [Sandaracinus amylolyticus]UJR85060.1 Hypothetical protein I5071_71390 [Sandaracinus amylolyticus]
MKGVFVTATGTGAGKTTVAAALARALRADSVPVAALKPIETGVDPDAADARALAEACGDPTLADDPRWYRAAAPLSPYAAQLDGGPPLHLDQLLATLCEYARSRFLLVEGAGGLLVPLDRDHTIADLAVALHLPLIVVAPDRLGVLSDTLATCEAAARRGLTVGALVLNRTTPEPDVSTRSNARILSERLPWIPIVLHGYGATDVDPALRALAR